MSLPLPNTARRRLLLGACAATVCPASAFAQARAAQTLRIVVPYVPGGGTDLLARLLGPAMAEDLGMQSVVDNRPGGGSTIGTQAVAKATPDGQMIGMIDAAFITNPSLVAKLPYDTLKDFTPIAFVAVSPLVMVVPMTLPVKNVAEFVAYAKARPGQLSFGSAGNGTGVHLAAEQFCVAAGLKMQHIPYKGTGQAITELVGGQTHMLFTTQSAGKPMVVAGRMRALGITSSKRSPVMPEVPTFIEAGWPAVDAVTINGLVGPAGMPADLVAKLNASAQKALKNREIEARMVEQGFTLTGGSAEDFAAWIRAEIPKWGRIIKEAGIKPE